MDTPFGECRNRKYMGVKSRPKRRWALLGLLVALGCGTTNDEARMAEAVRAAYDEQLTAYERQHRWKCEAEALEQAIVIADSIVAELYARTLRAQDTILQRPKRPEAPRVSIPRFPLDSLE